jgi:hypothetical protein
MTMKLLKKYSKTFLSDLSLSEMYVAEYSPMQDCFHHQTLIESMRDNQSHVRRKCKGYDWIIFYIGTKEKCYQAIDQMRKAFEQKDMTTACHE